MTAGLDVVGLFARAGRQRYGERVTQLDHALQCAAHARRDRADDEVVIAALLHDVGHLRETAPAKEAPDRHHGADGADLLRAWVPPRLAWLVEHHVVAKRYLVTIDPRYAACLSSASRRSLSAQGATLEAERAFTLETHPWFGDAVRIRRWDDAAKEPDAVCPPLIDYRALLERWFGTQQWAAGPGLDR